MNAERTYHQDEQEVNEALKRQGIQNTVDDLLNPEIHPEAVGVLLELFKRPYGGPMLQTIAAALFRRPMSAAQKEEAVRTCLRICHSGMDRPYSAAEMIAGNALADNVGPQHVREIGEMLLDRARGERRAVFARALGKVANDIAISYLHAGAKHPETANLAITELARLLLPGEAVEICDTALALPDLRYRKNVEEIRAKLQRKLKKRQPAHLTDELPPEGMQEWSSNIDGGWLPKISKGIRKVVEQGFGQKETAEIRTVMDGMSPDQIKTLKFEVTFERKSTSLWIQLSCDDEDAFDLYLFAPPELIRRLRSEIRLG